VTDDLSAAIERLERFAETNDIWTAYLGFTHPLPTMAGDLRAVLPSLVKPADRSSPETHMTDKFADEALDG
jgi:hypothetical protein